MEVDQGKTLPNSQGFYNKNICQCSLQHMPRGLDDQNMHYVIQMDLIKRKFRIPVMRGRSVSVLSSPVHIFSGQDMMSTPFIWLTTRYIASRTIVQSIIRLGNVLFKIYITIHASQFCCGYFLLASPPEDQNGLVLADTANQPIRAL